MQGKYNEVTTITAQTKLIDSEKLHKIIVGGLVFAVIILIYFVGLNFIDPAGTEIVLENNESSDPILKKEIVVYVSGAVENPGIYKLFEESRVADAISAADGIKSNSNEVWVTKYLNLSNYVEDEQKIYIPFEWDEVDAKNVVKIEQFVDESIQKDSKVLSNKTENLINVNLASQSDLTSLSGIGEVYSTMLINNRPYGSLEDIKSKTEIPDKTLEKIAEKLAFD